MIDHPLEISLGLAFLLGLLHALEPGHGKTALFLHAAGGARHRLLPIVMGVATGLSHTVSLLLIALLVHAATHFATGDHLHEDTLLRTMQYISSGIIMAIGLWVLVTGWRGGAAACSCCDHHDGEGDAAAESAPLVSLSTGEVCETPVERPASARSGQVDLRVTALLGAAVGLLPCPSALAAYFAGLSGGRPADAYWGVAAFGLGIALSLMIVGFVLQRLGTRLQHQTHRLASPRVWAVARGLLFIGIGVVYLAHAESAGGVHTH